MNLRKMRRKDRHEVDDTGEPIECTMLSTSTKVCFESLTMLRGVRFVNLGFGRNTYTNPARSNCNALTFTVSRIIRAKPLGDINTLRRALEMRAPRTSARMLPYKAPPMARLPRAQLPQPHHTPPIDPLPFVYHTYTLFYIRPPTTASQSNVEPDRHGSFRPPASTCPSDNDVSFTSSYTPISTSSSGHDATFKAPYKRDAPSRVRERYRLVRR
jgi:hypothetical protein